MAQIDLRPTEVREAFGLSTETVLIPSQQTKKHQKQSRRGRDDARTLILHECAYRELTFREIAEKLERSKSPYLRNLIYEMCREGLLSAREDMTHNHLIVHKFIAR